MNRSLFVLMVMLIIIIGTILGNYLMNRVTISESHTYYLEIDEVTDSITVMNVVNELGDEIMIIDDDISRHNLCNSDVIINAVETQIGWESMQEAVNAYYDMIWRMNNPNDTTIPTF